MKRSMGIVMVNLERRSDRRERMAREFEKAGLSYKIQTAVDAHKLTPEHLARVDHNVRDKVGVRRRPDNGAIACWLSHCEVMQDLVENGPDMTAVFEDDARFHPHLAKVLAVLESKPFDFDLVSLYRAGQEGSRLSSFVPRFHLTDDHWAGFLRFSDVGSAGYVITRPAARHFLETVPKMIRGIDWDLIRPWVSGLNTFYVDPPVVRHADVNESDLEGWRRTNKTRNYRRVPVFTRFVYSMRQSVKKRLTFRRLMKGKIGVTRW